MKVWQVKKSLKKEMVGDNKVEMMGCITGPGVVCGGPSEEAAATAPPSNHVSPA